MTTSVAADADADLVALLGLLDALTAVAERLAGEDADAAPARSNPETIEEAPIAGG